MLDSASPLYWQGMLFRVWCASPSAAHLLEGLVRSELPLEWEPLKKTWVDFGPELDVPRLEKAVRAVASDHNIRTWTDAELVKHLKEIEKAPQNKIKRLREHGATI
jgi:hypothetical protein